MAPGCTPMSQAFILMVGDGAVQVGGRGVGALPGACPVQVPAPAPSLQENPLREQDLRLCTASLATPLDSRCYTLTVLSLTPEASTLWPDFCSGITPRSFSTFV